MSREGKLTEQPIILTVTLLDNVVPGNNLEIATSTVP